MNKIYNFFIKLASLGLSAVDKKNSRSSLNKKLESPEDIENELYCLNGEQLKNLIDKNIYFYFFQLKPNNSSHSDNSQIQNLELKSDNIKSLSQTKSQDTQNLVGLNKVLKKTKLKAQHEILEQLKSEDLQHPVVLVCPDGELSKTFSKELRDKGLVNCYYLKKGFQSIKDVYLV